MLNILHDHIPIHIFLQLLIDIKHLREILPATRRRKFSAVDRRLHPVKIRRPRRQISNDCRMQLILYRIFLPYCEVRLHLDFFHTVHRDDIELPDRFIILRRISRCHDHPALRDRMISEHLALQKLQHCRSERLRHAVDLIDKENALRKSGLLHFIIDRRDNLAHRIFRDGVFLSAVLMLRDKRQTDRTLPRMVRDRIGHEPDAALLCDLLHDLRLANTRRAEQQHRPLPDLRNHISPVFILQKICLDRILDLLLCTLNIHPLVSSPDPLPPGSA